MRGTANTCGFWQKGQEKRMFFKMTEDTNYELRDLVGGVPQKAEAWMNWRDF
jgi:hypothetical protein